MLKFPASDPHKVIRLASINPPWTSNRTVALTRLSQQQAQVDMAEHRIIKRPEEVQAAAGALGQGQAQARTFRLFNNHWSEPASAKWAK